MGIIDKSLERDSIMHHRGYSQPKVGNTCSKSQSLKSNLMNMGWYKSVNRITKREEI